MTKLALAIVMVASRVVLADPALPRVLTAPTAWLPVAGSAVGTIGLDQRGNGSIVADLGLGGLAAIELGADTDVRSCGAPPCATDGGTDNLAQSRWQARAAFRVGARQDAWFVGQPAVVLGVRTAIANVYEVGEAYLVASREVGLLRLHAGLGAMDARHQGDARMTTKLAPIAAVELTPPQYPKTSLMLDVAWLPRFDLPLPEPEPVFGVGVRYQARPWGSIELDVRNRAEGLPASTVMVRINAVLGG